MDTYLVIPAGGKGLRLGSDLPKQYLSIKNKEIISYTIDAFIGHDLIKEIFIAVHPEMMGLMEEIINKYSYKGINLVEGGDTRQESVFNCLSKIPDESYVLVHDAVRPFIKRPLIDKLIEELNNNDGVIPITPIKDTIKLVEDDYIARTVDRNRHFSAQTPQAFITKVLKDANKNVDINSLTDDASIFEANLIRVKTISGDPENFKITTQMDLKIAEMIISYY